jgi:PGF-CTERM motif
MNKIIKLIAVVLVLSMLSFPVLGEMTGGVSYGSDGNGMDANRSDMQRESGNNDSMKEKVKEMHDNGSRMRDAEGMMGMGFIHSGDDSYGNIVTFSVDNNTGNVLNFGISGIAVFDSIKITGFDFKSSTTEGAETLIKNTDDSIVVQIHDNPAAVIEIKADTKATMVFNLAAGVSASKQDNLVTIIAQNITAYIVSEKATSINIAGSQVIIETSNGNTVFRASPVNMPHDDMEERFMGEVKTKRAGAEVSVGESDKYSIVNYSDMNVTMDSIEPNHMRMMVNSSDHAGKFILMNIDNSSLNWNEGDRISLHLDNQMMKEVMTEQELYNATESSFWLHKTGPNRMEALMYIHNFSTHQVDIVVEAAVTRTSTPVTSTITATATPKTPGFGLVLGTLATLAAIYAARRKT